MKRSGLAIVLALGVYVLLALAINGFAGVTQPELGAGAGEGVLRTFADDGSVYERRLAVLDDGGTLWLVSVQYFRRWYDELSRNPEVELVREGDVERYRAVPVDTPEARDRMTELMRSRAGPLQYGLMRAVWFFAEIKPVRLDPPASSTRP